MSGGSRTRLSGLEDRCIDNNSEGLNPSLSTHLPPLESPESLQNPDSLIAVSGDIEPHRRVGSLGVQNRGQGRRRPAGPPLWARRRCKSTSFLFAVGGVAEVFRCGVGRKDFIARQCRKSKSGTRHLPPVGA